MLKLGKLVLVQSLILLLFLRLLLLPMLFLLKGFSGGVALGFFVISDFVMVLLLFVLLLLMIQRNLRSATDGIIGKIYLPQINKGYILNDLFVVFYRSGVALRHVDKQSWTHLRWFSHVV